MKDMSPMDIPTVTTEVERNELLLRAHHRAIHSVVKAHFRGDDSQGAQVEARRIAAERLRRNEERRSFG